MRPAQCRPHCQKFVRGAQAGELNARSRDSLRQQDLRAIDSTFTRIIEPGNELRPRRSPSSRVCLTAYEARLLFTAILNISIKASIVGLSSRSQNIVHPLIATSLSPRCLQGTGGRPALLQEARGRSSAETEKCHESAYRCSRVGHAACQPDLRPVVSRRAAGADQRVPGKPQLRRQRLLIAVAATTGVLALQENKVLKNVRIAWIAAAMVVASPAFAGWPADQPAQLDLISDQRIIREIVVDGHLIEADSDDASANELRPIPNWIDGSGDRARQHSY